MEHHSNIVPWQLLCAARSGPSCATSTSTTRTSSTSTRSTRELARGHVKLVARRATSPMCSARSIRSRRSPRRAHDAGALALVDGAQAIPHMPRRRDARSVPTSTACTGHKVYGPTGIGVLYGRRELLEEMPPFLGGGDMISRVDCDVSTWNALPWKFEAGTPPYVEAAGLGAAIALARRARASRPSRRTSTSSRATRSSGSGGRGHHASTARSTPTPRGTPSRSRSRASTRTTSPRSSAATASAFAPATIARSR